MIWSEATFPVLALCAGPPGHPAVAERLRRYAAPIPWRQLLRDADYHGLEPLLRTHLIDAGYPVPDDAAAWLRTRWMQHAHAAAVRARVMAEVLQALSDMDLPVLVLKGAALAQMVYADPLWRPMRDVDLLVRARDARRAYSAMVACGFAARPHALPPDYHHLPALSKTVDGATVTVELHHQILRATPGLPPLGYDELEARSQPFEWSGATRRTLGCEDMLWHIYAHAFAINLLYPGIRLISAADLAAITVTWLDRMDWDQVRRRYGRAWRALPLLHHLTPWPPHIVERLGWDLRRVPRGVGPIAPSIEWSAAACRDVICPPDWWLAVRYGIASRAVHWWYRLIGHPVRFAVAGVMGVIGWIAARIRPPRDHDLLLPAGREDSIMVSRQVIDGVLSEKTLALVGASRNGEGFGNVIRKELAAKGYTILLVHPEAAAIDGMPCARSLAEVAPRVGGAILVTPPASTTALVREAAAAGIRRIWMQQGAASPDAIAFCKEQNLMAVHGECILMFAEPAAWFHRIHRGVNRLIGRLPR